MKTITTIILLLAFNTTQAKIAENCERPNGQFTSIEMVLNQFIFNDGNPNWGDWCFEVNTSAESKACNAELDAWDTWVECSNERFEKSCRKWADKENFASTEAEYENFITECVENNYKTF